MGETLQILTAMIIYMAAVIILGVTFARKANASSDAYFLGGPQPRTLGDGHERGGVRYVRLAPHGPAGRGLLVRDRGCGLDGHRTGCRYIHQLADRVQTASPVQ